MKYFTILHGKGEEWKCQTIKFKCFIFRGSHSSPRDGGSFKCHLCALYVWCDIFHQPVLTYEGSNNFREWITSKLEPTWLVVIDKWIISLWFINWVKITKLQWNISNIDRCRSKSLETFDRYDLWKRTWNISPKRIKMAKNESLRISSNCLSVWIDRCIISS